MTMKIFKQGDVDDKWVNDIIRYIERVYRLSNKYPEYLEINIYDKVGRMESILYIESLERGAFQPGDIYFAMHDAYYGWPRIHVCIELIEKLPREVWIGGLEHEAVHALLHGSLEYYYITLPNELRIFCISRKFTDDECISILHYISIAVKDNHVTRFLIRHGLTDEEYPFILYSLDLRDLLDRYSEVYRDLDKLVILLVALKSIALAYPYLDIEKYKNEVYKMITGIVEAFKIDFNVKISDLNRLFTTFKEVFREDLIKMIRYIISLYRDKIV